MKLKLASSTFLLLLVACLAMSNKAGRAKNQSKGSTGAPGDNDLVGTALRTCQGCHAGSATIQVTLTIEVLDGATAVTSYVPGKAYTARVTVNKVAGAPAAYGFQMIALKDAGDTDLKGFSAPSANAQLSTTPSNGRIYAEHKGPSATNTFEVTWTAPASGTGPVTFYAAGNGVNGNNESGGDAAAKTTLKITESTTSAGEAATSGTTAFSLSENPVTGRFFIKMDETTGLRGSVEVAVFDMVGRPVFLKKEASAGDPQAIEADASDWRPGLYIARLTAGGRPVTALRLVKI